MDPSGFDPDQACLDGTRDALPNRIVTWSQNRQNSATFMWISGQIGMGKTAIANSICQRLYNIRALAACFFCQRDNPNSNDPLRVINSLARSLAIRLPPYAQEITNAIREDLSLCTSHLTLRYEHLVKRPLERLRPLSVPTTLVVVVDGLDECGSVESRERLLHKLHDMSRLVPWLKYFETHCPESPIIRLQDYDASDGIRAFMQGQLGQLARKEFWPDDSINRLCTMAQGVFMWAALATKYLKRSTLPSLPRLQKVLNNRKSPMTDQLDTFYATALKMVIDHDEDEIKEAYLRCIGALIATSERTPLTISDLKYLLPETGQIDPHTLEQIVKNLDPFLRMTDGNRIQLHHSSFKDFVTDSSRSGEFHIRPDQYEAELASCCLKVLQRELKFNICGLETSHTPNSEVLGLALRVDTHIGPVLKYACIHWIDHFVASPNQALVDVVKAFLKGPQLMYWIEALSLLGQIDAAIAGFSKLSSLDLTQFDDRNILLFWAKDAYRFLLSFHNAISTSTPHLYISALAFSPNRSLTAQRMRPFFPNTITVVRGGDSSWHPCVATTLHPHPIQSLLLSPDGARIITGYSDGSLAVWSAQSGARIAESLVGHGDSVTCLALSLDGSLLVSGSSDTMIRLWNPTEGLQDSRVLSGHTGAIHSVTLSPNGTLIASGSYDRTIRLWDTKTLRPIRRPYAGHSNRISCLAFSPDGTKLVSGSWDKTIRIWSVNQKPEGSQLSANPLLITGHSSSVTCVAFSPDGANVASGSVDKTIRMWDAQTGRPCKSCDSPAKHSQSVTSIAFSSDGRLIASGCSGGEIQLRSTSDFAVFSGVFGHQNTVNGLAFSPNGTHILSGSVDMTFRVWDINASPVPMNTELIVGHTNFVLSVAVSVDGTRIISGSRDKTVRIWDAKSGAPIGDPLTGHSAYVNSVAISPDGARVISGSDDKSLKLWDTGSAVALNSYRHDSAIHSIAFSPHDTLIVFGAEDSNIYLWDTEEWKQVKESLKGHSGPVYSVAFSSDGALIASGSKDKTVILWDTQVHRRSRQTFSGHTDWVRSVAFSPCGSWLASASEDKTVRLWDTRTGSTIWELKGHSSYIRAVAFSPDGSCVVSGSDDKTVRVWNVNNGQLIQQPFTGHSDYVRTIAISPNGSYVISGSDDNTIRVWSLDTPSFSNQANDSPGVFCWPTSPYELSPHPHHPGWASHNQGSLYFWLPSHYQQPEQFLYIKSSLPQILLDYSKFFHGTEWAQVACDSIRSGST